jgi:hypothetical protein
MGCQLEDVRFYNQLFVREEGKLREVDYAVNREHRTISLRVRVDLCDVRDDILSQGPCPLSTSGTCRRRACLPLRSHVT